MASAAWCSCGFHTAPFLASNWRTNSMTTVVNSTRSIRNARIHSRIVHSSIAGNWRINSTGMSRLIKQRGRMHSKFVQYRRKCRRLRVFSMSDEPAPSEMSFESALKLLGVPEGASFDEILKAKKSLVEKSDGNKEQILQVEAAYDALLMRRLMKRRAGEVADSSVLYADVRSSSSLLKGAGAGGLNFLKGALKNIPLTVEAPPSSLVATEAAVYGGLIALTYASGLNALGGDSSLGGADTTGVSLAIGFGASLYFLRQQNLKLGKAAAITTAGLVAGAVVGNVVESWLRVDIVPVIGISSPSVVVSEFVLLSLWLFSMCVR